MASKCNCVLAAIALVLSAQPFGTLSADPVSDAEGAPSQGTGTTSISGLTVKPGLDGQWLLDFDYVFTGVPRVVDFHIEVPPQAGTDSATFRSSLTRLFPPQPGAHHVSTVIQYPGEGTSVEVVVTITASPDGRVVASQRLDQVIKWPSQDEKDFDTAYAMIENGSKEMLRQARLTLERLLGKNPRFDPAFVELARIAMKTSWGPEGLHQAETLLDSALEIRPDSVNAKILLGYVYTHQGRFREAEAQLTEAARKNPPNFWLWTNWGELLETQGNIDEAIIKYREAVTRPLGSMKYYGARKSAYVRLLALLEERNDANGMEALYEQRISEFGPSSCYSADYARFKLTVRRDAQGAIDLARAALDRNCEDAQSRQILGLASYVQWAESAGAKSVEALNQARVFLPAGPMTLYLLASTDATMPAAQKLLAVGEAIDQKDNDEMTALALALQMDELEAAERLLRLGARPDALVSAAAIPVALLVVLDGNLAGIRVMQRAGVDYAKLGYRGATALDFAKEIGDDALLRALTPNQQSL